MRADHKIPLVHSRRRGNRFFLEGLRNRNASDRRLLILVSRTPLIVLNFHDRIGRFLIPAIINTLRHTQFPSRIESAPLFFFRGEERNFIVRFPFFNHYLMSCLRLLILVSQMLMGLPSTHCFHEATTISENPEACNQRERIEKEWFVIMGRAHC